MIYILILLSSVTGNSDAKKMKGETITNSALEYLRNGELITADSVAIDPEIKGYIKILQDDFNAGLGKLKESALSGNERACRIFILSKLGVENNELKRYIRLVTGMDSTGSFSSDFIEYFIGDVDTGEVSMEVDSMLRPYFIYKNGMLNDRLTDFEKIIHKYPGSVPAIISRNIIGYYRKKDIIEKR